MHWNSFLSFVDGTSRHHVLLLNGNDGCAAIDVEDRRILWTKLYTDESRQRHMDAVCCDIDGDGDIEFIEVGSSNIPGKYHMHVRDAMTGVEEYNVTDLPLGSHGLVVNDLDGDGILELVVNSRDTIVVYDDGYQFIDDITFDGARVTGGSSIVLYAMYKEYRVDITIDQSKQRASLDRIRLILDPEDTAHEVVFHSGNGTLTGTGPMKPGSALVETTGDELTISIGFLVNWTFPHEDPFGIEMLILFEDVPEIGMYLPRVFRVENDIGFSGSLALTQAGAPVDGSSWLPGNALLEGGGLSVTYQGAPDKQVAPRHYSMGLMVGGVPREHDCIDGRIDFSMNLSSLVTGRHYGRMMFTEYPEGVEVDEVSFQFLLDADPPDILATIPEYEGWYSSDDLVLGLLATDGNGSGTDPGSVELRMARVDDFGPETEWRRYEPAWLSQDAILQYLIEMHFENGIYSYQWKVSDVAGNPPAVTPVLQLKVDVIEVRFSGVFPTGWQNRTDVETGINVSLGSTYTLTYAKIQYAYWNDLEMSPSWSDLDRDLAGGTEVDVSVIMAMVEGRDNYVQWRLFVNESVVHYSSIIWVQVDVTPPTMGEPDPPIDGILEKGVATLRVPVYDELSGIDPGRLYFGFSSRPGSPPDSWSLAGMEDSGTGPVAVMVVDGSTGGEFFVWIRVFDLAGNVNSSDSPYRIVFNRPPRILLVSPPNGTIFNESEPIELRVELKDPDGDDGIIVRWRLPDGSWNATGISAELLDLPVGNHTIIVTVDDGHGNVVERELTVEVVESVSPPGTDDGPEPDKTVGISDVFPFIILVVIIVLVTVSLLILRERSRLAE